MTIETDELQAEYDRLAQMPKPTGAWEKASWIRGAMYALAWVINSRGAQVPPSIASRIGRWVERP